MSWAWRDEPAPPPPVAVVGVAAVARALWQRLRSEPEDARAGQSVTAHPYLLLVTGASDQLPWVEGVRYAAPRDAAPGLWLPTLERPDVPLDLLATAIARRHATTPVLLWHAPPQLVPLHRLLPASDAVLARIAQLWAR
jgi:hypothetical protein